MRRQRRSTPHWRPPRGRVRPSTRCEVRLDRARSQMGPTTRMRPLAVFPDTDLDPCSGPARLAAEGHNSVVRPTSSPMDPGTRPDCQEQNTRSIIAACPRSTARNPAAPPSTACPECRSGGRSTRTWAALIAVRSAMSGHSSGGRTGRPTIATAVRSGSRSTSSRSSGASWRGSDGLARASSSARRLIHTSPRRAAID
jgi:hypothetical protein